MSLNHNSKKFIPSGCELVNVIVEMAGVLPLVDGNGRHGVEDAQRGLAGVEQIARRALRPSVPRDGNVSQPAQ